MRQKLVRFPSVDVYLLWDLKESFLAYCIFTEESQAD